MRNLFLLLVLLGSSLASPLLFANQRIALVIGNNAYPESPLFNPVNDAVAMDAALSELGFEVVRATDADLDAMQEALLEFSGRIEEGATALVFYAGHGIQANGRNYLVPIDAELASENRLRFEALEMSDLLEELEYSPSKLNIVIVDACRNNPFLRRFRGGSSGLAAVDAASGTLIAYATAPGSVASDGSGRNGLYTEHLLQALRAPGEQVEAVFKQVRIAVTDATDGEQVPWESSSLTGDFVFNQAGMSHAPADGAVAAPSALATEAGAEALFWDSVRNEASERGLRAYLDRYPDGTFASLARARIEALAGADRCDDLSGPWEEYRDDRACASRIWLQADPEGGADAYRGRTEVCADPGLLGGLSRGTSTGEGSLESGILRQNWQHGPCSGTAEYEMNDDCTAGVGRVVGVSGGFGTCAGIRLEVRIQRLD